MNKQVSLSCAPPSRPLLSRDSIISTFLYEDNISLAKSSSSETSKFGYTLLSSNNIQTQFAERVHSLINKKSVIVTSDENQFTWDSFTSELTIENKNNPRLRELYDHFIKLIKEWLNDPNAQMDMIYDSADVVYSRLSKLNRFSYIDGDKKALEAMLGSIKQSTFKEIFELSMKLRSSLNDLKEKPDEDCEDLFASNQSNTHYKPVVERFSPTIIDNGHHTPYYFSRLNQLNSHFSVSAVPSTKHSVNSIWGNDIPLNDVIMSQSLINTVSKPYGVPPADFFKVDPSVFLCEDHDYRETKSEEGSEVDIDVDGDGDYINNNYTTSTSTSASVSASVGSWEWLVAQCEPLATFNDDGSHLISETTLAQSALSLLQSTRSDDLIQGDLFDLLGYESFDIISSLLQHRASMKNVVVGGTSTSTSKKSEEESGVGYVKTGKTQGVGLTIIKKTSKAEKEKQKMYRRFANMSSKLNTNSNTNPSSGSSSTLRGGVNRAAMDAAKDKLINSLAAYKYTSINDPKSLTPIIGSELPEGSTREVVNGVETVCIPVSGKLEIEEDKLIPVTEVDERVRKIFKFVRRFNTLQTQVFDCAYRRNENMLVCAPTGAGKTNVALLTVAREVLNNMVDGVLMKNNFKIVYVAPMKALAAEVAGKFQSSLASLGVVVRELTGDMQLTKAEIERTQILVTTPEKWDVITRKSNDNSLLEQVKLLIIDEIHLLHEDRGPVIEVLVARCHRHIETTQKPCRIVGLSATLPNYTDVAQFLCVNKDSGLFYFDQRYRPVPLEQKFIGLSVSNALKRQMVMNDVCYEQTTECLKSLSQCMVFVTSRRDTVKTALMLINKSKEMAEHAFFATNEVEGYTPQLQQFNKVSNTPLLKELARDGVGVHHAGLTRAERTWMEKAFSEGRLSVLVTTSTLAWGVNLPAHRVIIKGTQIYDSKRGGWCDMGMADVMQIFGRAGRPQFDTSGEAVMITTQQQMYRYLTLLTNQLPIESQMIASLPDHLNAEIVLGTVTNAREADSWLTYTYLYNRMLKNPTMYGVSLDELQADPTLSHKRRELILQATKTLMAARMLKYDYKSGNYYGTDIGRVASVYYIQHDSMLNYNTKLHSHVHDEQLLEILADSREFSQLKVREEEIPELIKMKSKCCVFPLVSPVDTVVGKVNVLIQAYISNYPVSLATLQSDAYFVTQSLPRLTRALFELAMKKKDALLTSKLLDYCKMVERRQWLHLHPLRQFKTVKHVRHLEQQDITVDQLCELDVHQVADLISSNTSAAQQLLDCVHNIPWLGCSVSLQPVTRDVGKLVVTVDVEFTWNKHVHGESVLWWLWVENPDNNLIYHSESWTLTRDMSKTTQKIICIIPLHSHLTNQYILRLVADGWIGSDIAVTVPLHNVFVPDDYPTHTDLLPLHPLPVTALRHTRAEQLYKRFTHFNPIQTQLFHTLYHTNNSCFIGAPTGSGKTVLAELAMLQSLNNYPDKKMLYIAPMKALVTERYNDWNSHTSFNGILGCNVVELTGDRNPDPREIRESDLIVTTPEKWDGLSRQWMERGFIREVGLVIIDEVHLLGQERGSVLEVLVSRMKYMAHSTKSDIRFIGLSTALSNAVEISQWLGTTPNNTFNFHPVMRPVPLSMFISGFPGKHYCPRMATMNKPIYNAINTHSPDKPVLIFVSSRRQTRLTGLDLISYAMRDGSPTQFLHITEEELTLSTTKIQDPNVSHLLGFGIGLHHAGMTPEDRHIVEQLYLQRHIQVLICTSTLAWGINVPAHLVIVKGTEYYDGKTHKYIDYSLTDVLQMVGRAGRPQYDDSGKAVVMVHEPKKAFYHKFLHSPFPLESSLHEWLHNHINAEIAQGTITCLQDAVDWLSWTFYFTRLINNPSYYGLVLPPKKKKKSEKEKDKNSIHLSESHSRMLTARDIDSEVITTHMLKTLGRVLADLEKAGCITIDNISHTITSTSLGSVCNYYYLDYQTVTVFMNDIHQDSSWTQLFHTLTNAHEYSNIPVRHNEDVLNGELVPLVPMPITNVGSVYLETGKSLVDPGDPHVKTNILLQCRWSDIPLPSTDYKTDTITVLNQCMRVLHAMVDTVADAGWLQTVVQCMSLVRMIVQGSVYEATEHNILLDITNFNNSTSKSNSKSSIDHELLQMPYFTEDMIAPLHKAGVSCMQDLLKPQLRTSISQVLNRVLDNNQVRRVLMLIDQLPRVNMAVIGDVNNNNNNTETDTHKNNKNKKNRNKKKNTNTSTDSTTITTITTDTSAEYISVPVTLQRTNVWSSGSFTSLRKQLPRRLLGASDVTVKREGWWLMAGCVETDEVYALQRVTAGLDKQTYKLEVGVPHEPGVYVYNIMLISDCYYGFDLHRQVILRVEGSDITLDSDDDGVIDIPLDSDEEYPDFT